jgi:hypothetical protein
VFLKSSKHAPSCLPFREKERAAAATDFLKQLILENSEDDGTLGFVIQNPQLDNTLVEL